MSTRPLMQKALQKIFVPALKERGFTGKFPHFRRIGPEGIDLLSFIFDKYGGGFTMDVAVCPAAGYLSPWSGMIAPEQVTAHLILEPRGRIGLGAAGHDLWFTYPTDPSPSPLQLQLFEKTAREAVERVDEQAESWWRTARAELPG